MIPNVPPLDPSHLDNDSIKDFKLVPADDPEKADLPTGMNIRSKGTSPEPAIEPGPSNMNLSAQDVEGDPP
jgi:hypothetical protein